MMSDRKKPKPADDPQIRRMVWNMLEPAFRAMCNTGAAPLLIVCEEMKGKHIIIPCCAMQPDAIESTILMLAASLVKNDMESMTMNNDGVIVPITSETKVCDCPSCRDRRAHLEEFKKNLRRMRPPEPEVPPYMPSNKGGFH
jgi:hypothetical protein